MFYREDLLLFPCVQSSMKSASDIWLLKAISKKIWTSGSWCADVTYLPNLTEFKTIVLGNLTLSSRDVHWKMLLMLLLVRNYSEVLNFINGTEGCCRSLSFYQWVCFECGFTFSILVFSHPPNKCLSVSDTSYFIWNQLYKLFCPYRIPKKGNHWIWSHT